MATIAPVIMSLVVWIVTQSAFALIFAGLGPLVAVGSFVDSRIQSRRRGKREQHRFALELDAARRHRAQLHADELSERDATAPSAPHVVEAGARWSAASRGHSTVTISVGRGESESSIQCDSAEPWNDAANSAADESAVDDSAVDDSAESTARRAIAHLMAEARILRNAPIAVDVEIASAADRSGEDNPRPVRLIGIVGNGAGALALARSIALQVTAVLPPDRFSLVARSAGNDWEWLDDLPHTLTVETAQTTGHTAPHGYEKFVERSTREETRVEPVTLEWVSTSSAESRPHSIRLVLARFLDMLPKESDLIVDVRGIAEGRILEHPDRRSRGPVMFETISLAQARAWAKTVAAVALREGRISLTRNIPDKVHFADLAMPSTAIALQSRVSTLECEFAVDEVGPITIDLVTDGPHAIVGGTTGSGKSELLISWVLALASRFSPADFTVLLVDFKGGSSFGNLVALPHCVGLLTDLDESTARRALESLAAEIKHRERALHEAGARSIDELSELHNVPRLVIVVDEFAAMASEHPDLHALFSDIAARGRSLGMHLILCTQRPAGVIPEAVFANSGLRISLRVNNKADSTAVIGSNAAAALVASERGRAILVRSGSEPCVIQCAIAAPSDVDAAVAQFEGVPPPRRPWLEPLSMTVTSGELQAKWADQCVSKEKDGTSESLEPCNSDLPWGISDRPEIQAQPVAVWNPHVDGHVLIIGQGRSGKSAALRAINEAVRVAYRVADVLAPRSPEAAWDVVTEALALVRSPSEVPRTFILLDDLDALLPRLHPEHQAEFTDRLVQLLREGPARGVYCAVAVHHITSSLQQCALLCGSRLILSVASRQDHVVAGGDPQHFSTRPMPGVGSWRGAVTRIAWSDMPVDTHALRVEVFSPTESFAVVATSPRSFVARLSEWSEFSGAEFDVVSLASNDLPSSSVPTGTQAEGLSIAPASRPRVLIGDPESWQSHWGSLVAARSRGVVVFDGCSLGEFRALTRERYVPPPLVVANGHVWLLKPETDAVRAGFLQPVASEVR